MNTAWPYVRFDTTERIFMQQQLLALLTEATQEIVTQGSPIAVGFDAAANEDNWGLCVLILSPDLTSAYMPLLLPQAKVNANGGVSPTLLCRPTKTALFGLVSSVTTSACPASIAVDIPFGWPDGHRFFVEHWTAQNAWQGPGEIPLRQDFERRWCDIELRNRYPFIQPLSVGADTIAQAAFCWSVVRNELHQFPMEVDVGLEAVQQSVAIFETYPAAFVKLAASDFGDYKRKPRVRRNLLASLREQYNLMLNECQTEWLEWACEQSGSPDAFDSFLCALTAWDHLRERHTPGTVQLTTPSMILNRPMDAFEADRIRREGWILVRSQ